MYTSATEGAAARTTEGAPAAVAAPASARVAAPAALRTRRRDRSRRLRTHIRRTWSVGRGRPLYYFLGQKAEGRQADVGETSSSLRMNGAVPGSSIPAAAPDAVAAKDAPATLKTFKAFVNLFLWARSWAPASFAS